MKKFLASYSEINYGSIIVEADTMEEAEKKAIEVYESGGVNWHDSEVSDILVEEEKV